MVRSGHWMNSVHNNSMCVCEYKFVTTWGGIVLVCTQWDFGDKTKLYHYGRQEV